MDMNSRRVTLLVLMDLSTAFDMADHTILLQRLQSEFGIKDAALSWLSSCLIGRVQRVSINGMVSDELCLIGECHKDPASAHCYLPSVRVSCSTSFNHTSVAFMRIINC